MCSNLDRNLSLCRLYRNEMGDEGCRHLADALKCNRSLTELGYVGSLQRGAGEGRRERGIGDTRMDAINDDVYIQICFQGRETLVYQILTCVR